MDGLGGYYAKQNKSDRERQILYDITYMWNLKNKSIVTITKKDQTHKYWKQTSGNQWEDGEGARRGKGLRGTNYK